MVKLLTSLFHHGMVWIGAWPWLLCNSFQTFCETSSFFRNKNLQPMFVFHKLCTHYMPLSIHCKIHVTLYFTRQISVQLESSLKIICTRYKWYGRHCFGSALDHVEKGTSKSVTFACVLFFMS